MIDPDSELEARYQSIMTTPDWYQTNIPCQVGCPAHTDEGDHVSNGLMVNGIASWRQHRKVIYEECNEYMEDLGVETHYNTRVGRDVMLTDLLKQYDAVFLGASCYISNPLTGPDNKV